MSFYVQTGKRLSPGQLAWTWQTLKFRKQDKLVCPEN